MLLKSSQIFCTHCVLSGDGQVSLNTSML